jgi:hypothetical protein
MLRDSLIAEAATVGAGVRQVTMVAGAHSPQCRKFVLLAGRKPKKLGIGMISKASLSAA